MYHHETTLKNVFYYTIDGKDFKSISLKTITYTVGWFNIPEKQLISSNGTDTEIPPGLWGLNALIDYMHSNGLRISIESLPWNGKLKLRTSIPVTFSDFLSDLFKFPSGLLNGVVESSESIQGLSELRNLHIHIEELDTHLNLVDGKNSTLLTVVGMEPYSYGDVRTVHFANPVVKQLRSGPISGINISIRDQKNNVVDNNNLPIELTLEIN